jgi:hypothetical protein
MLKELDPLVLTKPLPEYGLQPGDVGWVVMVHDEGAGYEVEFVTLAGETVSVVTIPPFPPRTYALRGQRRSRPRVRWRKAFYG